MNSYAVTTPREIPALSAGHIEAITKSPQDRYREILDRLETEDRLPTTYAERTRQALSMADTMIAANTDVDSLARSASPDQRSGS